MRRRIPAPLSAPQPPQGILPMPSPFFAHNKKRGHQWPRNSRNLLYFPCSWDNTESRPHVSRHARVGRTLLSDAFDLDLDFAVPAQSFAIPWKSGASAPRKTLTNEPRLQPLRYHQQLRHPERSMRIRLMNPHAQSKDPCTLVRTPTAPGSSPGVAG